MTDQKMIRLSQAAKKLNVGISTISEHLSKHGYDVGLKPNTKITSEQYALLVKEFEASMAMKQEAAELTIGNAHSTISIDSDINTSKDPEEEETFIPTTSAEEAPPETPVEKEVVKEELVVEEPKVEQDDDDKVSRVQLPGLKMVDKIDLEAKKKPKKKTPPTTTPTKTEKFVEENKVEANPKPVALKEEKVEEKVVETTKQEIEVPLSKNEDKTPEVESKPEEVVKNVKAEVEEKVKVEVVENKKETEVKEVVVEKEPAKEKVSEKTTKEASQKVEEKQTVTKEVVSTDVEKTTAKTEGVDESQDPASVIEAKADKLKGLKVVGKISLPTVGNKKKAKPVASSDESKEKRGKRKRVKRERINKPATGNNQGNQQNQNKAQSNSDRNKASNNNNKRKNNRPKKEEVSQKEVDASFKKTKAKLSGGNKDTKTQNKRQHRKDKRSANLAAREKELIQAQENAATLKITEFIPANELATMMDVTVNDVISKCLSMGMFVSINQRLDADTITIIADEFGFNVEFASAEEDTEVILEEEDTEESLEDRAPIVTIMGHVDHGKTSLLDYVRKAKVAEGEAGGITQHIGAYSVKTDSGKRLVFLDTPGHEAFTAMRARGAKVTDIVIIVIAADDSVMPQTVEAINHAQVAGVPIVIAINKIDRPNANPHKIKEELSNMNVLVEDWGGKYQSYEISAKTGLGIDDLLEGAILESDLLELKANPNKNAVGTVIEASLDKGRGYVTTMLVQTGTMKVGDIMLAGPHFGRVKAMTDHRGKKMKEAGPSTPVQVLGLNGAPQAGDKLNILDTEREAREIATKRQQILREQTIRATKRTTLKDIGKRIEIGNFQQLNVILKGDVDGSVEALSDSLLKLSTDEIEINIIHKAVGAISEGDILLASASDAVVIGFQVRPTAYARKLAEKEEIEVRLYSVIYDAINDVKDAMEGMLAPEIEEIVVGNAEVRETFKITKVGTIAGCMVTDGYLKRNSKIRLVRDGIVIYGGESGGEINALKRFKDDASEVRQGFECGISIKNYNDLKVGDVIEAFEQREIKRSL